ncbi:MAG: hypothetical protein QM504_10535 [Pseudomonadota bacterium]
MHSILKNNKFVLCLILFNLLIKPSQATEASTAAISCSALFFIMTSVSIEDPAFGSRMTTGAQLMHLVHGELNKKQTDGKVDNKYSFWLRDKVMKAYGQKFNEKSDVVVDDYIACDLWLGKLISHMQKESSNSDINNIPKPPKNFNVDSDIKNAAVTNVNKAFSAWDKFGRMTKGDVMLMLREKSKTKSGAKK